MAEIVLESVTKIFPGDVVAVDDVSLHIESGEFLVVVGPSGCGKSTVLRAIAGLESVTSGKVTIGGRDVTYLPPRDRDVAMVFQNYALYPHMSARANIGYGLRVRKVPKSEIDRRVEDVARMLGLAQMLDRRPGELSGGQRQRVAMGRAIVREPAAYLMDEPLSNLDAKLRVEMRAELLSLHHRLGVTTVYVTHDQVEAMTLGQRVAVLRAGRLQQLDTPQNLYRHPANLFVAVFIGSPSMNLVSVTIAGERVSFAGMELPVPDRIAAVAGARDVILGIRPEDFEDARFADPSLPQIEAPVAVVEDLGSMAHVLFTLDAPPVDAEDVRAAEDRKDETAPLVGGEEQAVFTATVDARTQARAGGTVRLAVDPERFYVFDVATGETLGAPAPAVAQSVGPSPAGPNGSAP